MTSFFRGLTATLIATTILSHAHPVIAQNATGETGLGPYLAVRQADQKNDFEAIIEFGQRALATQPDNTAIVEAVTIAQLVLGPDGSATPYAHRLESLNPDNQIARLVQFGDALANDKWATALALLDKGIPAGDLMRQTFRAWIELGSGRMSQSIAIYDTLSKDSNTRDFATFQKALSLALVGDFESAAKLMETQQDQMHLNRRGIIAYAQVLSQLDRHDDAIALIEKATGGTLDAELTALLAQLNAGEALPFDALGSPRDGIAELFYLIADNLAQTNRPETVLLYSRIAEQLAPNHSASTLLTAQLLDKMGHLDLAIAAYDRIPKSDQTYAEAAMGRSQSLYSAGRTDEAIGALTVLSDQFPERANIPLLLGEALSKEHRYEEARDAYETSISRFQGENTAQWRVYFAHAIALTKTDDWEGAEAGFRKALELSPNEPNVLNYLGYSYLEKKINLDEALSMIEAAVAARPNSGYIVDSLGWVYYRLGRYDEAVVQMERAVELLSVDPVLNDHLGDTYWAVGRKREAEFQWKRALSFISEDTDLDEMNPDRIRRKLEVGLDVVLSESGEPPLKKAE